jgi:hypothetical protein
MQNPIRPGTENESTQMSNIEHHAWNLESQVDKVIANDGDFEAAFKDQTRFVGFFRFDNIETGAPNHIDRVHLDQELVLDDQDNRPCFSD